MNSNIQNTETPVDDIRSARPVLVTGGSGFVGNHLVKTLVAQGKRVRVLVRPNSINSHRLDGLDVEVVEGDVVDRPSLRCAVDGCRVIYHTAGVMKGDWNYTHKVNVVGVKNLIDLATTASVDRLVYLSDIEVYDVSNAKKKSIINEEWPRQNDAQQMGAYIHSRIEAEDLILAACEDRNLSAVILRASMIIGPSGQIFFPQLGYQYKLRYFFLLRRGRNVLPLIYIDNLVDAMMQASVDKNAIGQVFNLVDDAEIKVIDYIERFLEITKTSAQIISIPYLLPYLATSIYGLASRIGIVKNANTSRSRFKWKHAPVVFCNAKLKEQLRWSPAVSLRDGIDRTFAWYADQARDLDR